MRRIAVLVVSCSLAGAAWGITQEKSGILLYADEVAVLDTLIKDMNAEIRSQRAEIIRLNKDLDREKSATFVCL